MLTGEHGPGAPPGLDLVGHEHDPKLSGEPLDALQVSGGRDDEPALALWIGSTTMVAT